MKRLVLFLLAVTGLSLLVNGILFWIFEHGSNPNIHGVFDVVWWWVVTSATVGYGDIVPFTWQGRTVAIFAIISGFLVYTNIVALIVQAVHAFLERKVRGTAQVTSRDHIVICEYTAVADEVIQSLPFCEDFKDREVAIVSELVMRSPYPQHHYVCGVPLNPVALQLANIQYAAYVFVFANLRFADPDIKTLHMASRVLRLNPKATLFVELLDPGSDLLRDTTGDVIAMDSRDLIRSILRHEKIDPNKWLAKREGRGSEVCDNPSELTSMPPATTGS